VIIGKPAEISAVRNARAMRPGLDRNVGVTLSFFCAESPATRGTVALLEKLGTKPEQVGELRYRGHGWPGHFAPIHRGESEPFKRLTYRESWAFLQAHRPWSVHQWPDGSGELADISCGDPWYEEPDGRNPGFSLVVARTARGREIVEGAMRAGYLTLTVAEPWKLAKSQPNLLAKKGAVWGRRWAGAWLRLPVTQLAGLELKRCWSKLPVREKLKSTFGTLRRLLQRRLYRRLQLNHAEAVRVPAAE
jgi:coenzyme F420 hydrogenase subunit beta